jgi:hypothetical protein
MGYIEFKDLTHCALYLLDTRIAEFENMFAVLTNQMIMLAKGMGPFITRKIFSELMSCDKLTVQQ